MTALTSARLAERSLAPLSGVDQKDVNEVIHPNSRRGK